MYLKNKVFKISLRLSERDINALDDLSKHMNKNRSELIRFVIKSYLSQIERTINLENIS